MQFFTNLYFGSKLQKEVNNLSYKNVQYGRTRVRRNYASVQTNVELPNLIEIQTKSFAWFMDEGLRALFKEISPIKDQDRKSTRLNSSHKVQSRMPSSA